jgi:hypothetical protein
MREKRDFKDKRRKDESKRSQINIINAIIVSQDGI